MTNSRSTKSALFTSVVAILLCCTMLLGTTFAWFTDTATSANNVITAGNLDVEVYYKNAEMVKNNADWKNLEDINNPSDDLFKKDALWEPGHTEVAVLKIENKGNLALKYQANMNIVDEKIGKTKDGKDIKLSEILTVSTIVQAVDDWGVGDILMGQAFESENAHYQTTAKFTDANILSYAQKADDTDPTQIDLAPGGAHYLVVKVDMAETVGNEANHDGVNVPSINFGINVKATQFSYEKDSFGDQYDANATYSDIPVADVEETGEKVINNDLTLANTFVFRTTESAEQADASKYRNWHADFVVSTDKPIAEGTLTLAGQYDAWSENWVSFENDGLLVGAINENDEIRLLKTAGDAMNITNPYVNYYELCSGVKVFTCGLADTSDSGDALDGRTVTVELRLYETVPQAESQTNSENEETGHYITIGTYSHTFE